MITKISKQLFKKILLDKNTTSEQDLDLMLTIYAFDNFEATATELATVLGYKDKIVVNGIIKNYGKRVSENYKIERRVRDNGRVSNWDIFFNGHYEGTFFIWTLKNELRKAIEELTLTSDFSYSEELPTDNSLFEGLKKVITVNAYERNAVARELCIEHYGANCSVCNFNFEKTYGSIGKDYIHVHHITPISQIGVNYQVNPIKDLRPVCPNCHAMLHRQDETITITQLKKKLKK